MKDVFQSNTPLGIALHLILGLFAFVNLTNALTPSEVITVDFGIFMSSGLAARSGGNPYAGHVTWQGVGLPNLNPPPWLFLFRWLSHFDRVTAYNAWRFGNLAIYLLVTAVLLLVYRSRLTPARVVWVLALDGLSSTLYNGQVYIIILMLVAGAWITLEKRAIGWSAICMGVAVAFKPNLAICPSLLLMTGFWRLGLTSLIVAALAGTAPIVSFGTGVYHQWLAAVTHVTWLAGPGNASLWGLAHQVRLPQLALPLAVGFMALLTTHLRRRNADALTVFGIALPASLLLSPIAWSGYTLILLPLFLKRDWSLPLSIAACLLVVPSGIVDWWNGAVPWPFTALGSLSLTACLLASIDLAFSCRPAPSEKGVPCGQ